MSGPDIDFNKLASDAGEYATDELANAAEGLAALLDTLPEPQATVIRKYPVLAVGLALLAHLDARAEEQRIMREVKLAILNRIADSVEVAVDGVMQLIVGELKERWLISHQNHTEAELKAAMSYYDSMAVRGSGLKHDDK
ncbi:hypothetical protein SAMN05216315_14212 [Nitrosospira sp. Nsp18]|uniref:hypothetical protein n=1 Tax=Nitrosospira sp. Nsp18 TaxID=1855334 RepID=UPI00088C93C2|nr:hypothetical protein [Nitrosospira sp. Nsp18]SDA29188.1 hypothetical protein SAMN05216315_14212 [Nitrosospira sp. Nsp18]